MKRILCIAVAVALGSFSHGAELAELECPPLQIGRNLQTFTSARLSQPAPATGLSITLSSDDGHILLSQSPDRPGAPQLTLTVAPGLVESPDFYVQALNETGTATFTLSAPGHKPAKGKVVVNRSGVVMKAPRFRTTTRTPARVAVYSAMLDESGKPAVEQAVRAGFAARVPVVVLDPKIGTVVDTPLVIAGGNSSARTLFKPTGPGETAIRAGTPDGFDTPSEGAEMVANADVPGIGMLGEIRIGKDLQVEGDILLGENAPEEGLDVTLTSSDPAKIVFSTSVDRIGVGKLTVRVPSGQGRAHYYIQALSDSGDVTCTASAPGYRTRTAPLMLVPSGVIVAYAPNGPPDEANVLRPDAPFERREVTASLAKNQPVDVAVWTAYLDPITKRGADMTVQRLRPGVKAEIRLESSDPAVADTKSVTIAPTQEHAMARFAPRRPGRIVISASTPSGFTTASNATSLSVVVTP